MSETVTRTLAVAATFTQRCTAVVALKYGDIPDAIGAVRVLANGAWRWAESDPTAAWPDALRDLVAEAITEIMSRRAKETIDAP